MRHHSAFTFVSYTRLMIVLKKPDPEKKRSGDAQDESPGGSGIVHGTHETKDSTDAKKAAREADGSAEKYGNEWE